MSEFKFMCPVCGQHIAVDTGAAGAQIECPTCFQRILVPQAPRADSKFILSATQYIKPPVVPSPPSAPDRALAHKKLTSAILVSLVVASLLAAALYLLTQKGSDSDAAQAPTVSNRPASQDRGWNLDLDNTVFPGAAATGKIHDRNFTCQRAILQGGTLALSQNSGPNELTVNVYFATNDGPERDNRRFDVRTNRPGSRPRITLHWRDGSQHGSQTFSNGYAMKLELAQTSVDKAPGRIYLCLPDDSQSFVAGTFDAEIRKPISSR